MQRLMAYERVSTAGQGASGLGQAAQRTAIDAFAQSRNAEVLERFTEVESGRNPDRPELGKAINLAHLTGATLVIARRDRLSRNAAFLLTPKDSGVAFLACDMPEANDLTVGISELRYSAITVTPKRNTARGIGNTARMMVATKAGIENMRLSPATSAIPPPPPMITLPGRFNTRASAR